MLCYRMVRLGDIEINRMYTHTERNCSVHPPCQLPFSFDKGRILHCNKQSIVYIAPQTFYSNIFFYSFFYILYARMFLESFYKVQGTILNPFIFHLPICLRVQQRLPIAHEGWSTLCLMQCCILMVVLTVVLKADFFNTLYTSQPRQFHITWHCQL